MEYELIEKERLPHYHFVKADVLPDEESRRQRWQLLEKAVALGNDYKQKVRLIFGTTRGIKAIETTLWALTDGHVEIKAGIDIPVHSIYQVIL
jgi:xylose isomerase